jgi:hypothetical protein
MRQKIQIVRPITPRGFAGAMGMKHQHLGATTILRLMLMLPLCVSGIRHLTIGRLTPKLRGNGNLRLPFVAISMTKIANIGW